jgi:response regulator of citrate/malate metabolism
MFVLLIAEQDATTSALLQQSLVQALMERFGLIQIVHSLSDALFVIHQWSPSARLLVLVDMLLPDGTAFDVLGRCESDRCDVVCMSASADRELVRRAFKSGALDCVVKPLTAEQLRDIAQHFFLRHELASTVVQQLGAANLSPMLLPKEIVDTVVDVVVNDVVEKSVLNSSPTTDAQAQQHGIASTTLMLPVGKQMIAVELPTVVRCEAKRNAVLVVCQLPNGETQCYRTITTLHAMEQRLHKPVPQAECVRVHRSHIINLYHLQSFTPHFALMSDGKRVPLSPERIDALRERMGILHNP